MPDVNHALREIHISPGERGQFGMALVSTFDWLVVVSANELAMLGPCFKITYEKIYLRKLF